MQNLGWPKRRVTLGPNMEKMSMFRSMIRSVGLLCLSIVEGEHKMSRIQSLVLSPGSGAGKAGD